MTTDKKYLKVFTSLKGRIKMSSSQSFQKNNQKNFYKDLVKIVDYPFSSF